MGKNLMNDLLLNFKDFLEAGNDEFEKGRYNPSISSYFKAIAILCDYKIYFDHKLIPKNHSERFVFLKSYYPEAYKLINPLFDKYRDSYNIRMQRKDALELSRNIENLKRIFGIEE